MMPAPPPPPLAVRLFAQALTTVLGTADVLAELALRLLGYRLALLDIEPEPEMRPAIVDVDPDVIEGPAERLYGEARIEGDRLLVRTLDGRCLDLRLDRCDIEWPSAEEVRRAWESGQTMRAPMWEFEFDAGSFSNNADLVSPVADQLHAAARSDADEVLP